MKFNTFLNNIFSSFNEVFNNITNLFNLVLENNFIKLIIFITLIYLIIRIFTYFLDLVFNILSQKKESGKNKVKSNSDIE